MRTYLTRPMVIALACAVGVATVILGIRATDHPPAGAAAAPINQATSTTTNRSGKAVAKRAYSANDPRTWSRKRLAAQLILAGVQSTSLSSTQSWSKAGIGGIVLFGTPPSSLKSAIKNTRAKAPKKRLIVASDEEGGSVQRLTRLIGRYPSAAQIGRTKTIKQTESLARGLGKKLKRLGVNSDLAPVADLLYRGSWTARDGRAFKSNPKQDARYVAAFAKGLQRAGVSSTLKHWPGGGAVADTHVGAGTTPSWSKLNQRDLLPFKTAFKAGAASVMVSHARVPGLTGSLPATQSTKAYRALRKQAGNQVVIMTDSLGMAAVTKAMRQSQIQAAIRALSRGADLALIQGPNPHVAIKQIAKAIGSGKIKRVAAVESAKRVLTWQRKFR